ncbi:MAG: hypothetical protein U0521_17940 [Anaerolineae bacterium]
MNVVATVRGGLRNWFQHRPNQFIERMREQAYIVALGTEALVDYMEHPNKKNAIACASWKNRRMRNAAC